MTFTFSLTTDVGKTRFQIGDTISGQGVRANGANFSDEEIAAMLAIEGSVMCATAACCEMLARDWTKVSVIGAGSEKESLASVAAEWLRQAKYLRGIYGYGAIEDAEQGSFNFSALRQDGYSNYAGGVVSPNGDLH